MNAKPMRGFQSALLNSKHIDALVLCHKLQKLNSVWTVDARNIVLLQMLSTGV